MTGGRRSTETPEAARDTRERLLEVAEELFGQLGVEGTSLRAITSKAGANLAAVNYHFGSKEGLVREVFARRLRPINERRLALLDAIEGVELAGPERLRRIVEAFIAPVLQFAAEDPTAGERGSRMMGRALVTPAPEVKAVLQTELQPTAMRFVQELRAVLPHLSRDDFFTRFLCMVGAMAHSFAPPEAFREVFARITDSDPRAQQPELAQRRIVEFVVAGLSAPPVADPPTDDPGPPAADQPSGDRAS